MFHGCMFFPTIAYSSCVTSSALRIQIGYILFKCNELRQDPPPTLGPSQRVRNGEAEMRGGLLLLVHRYRTPLTNVSRCGVRIRMWSLCGTKKPSSVLPLVTLRLLVRIWMVGEYPWVWYSSDWWFGWCHVQWMFRFVHVEWFNVTCFVDVSLDSCSVSGGGGDGGTGGGGLERETPRVYCCFYLWEVVKVVRVVRVETLFDRC